MAEPANHPTDLLQDAVDGRLEASQRAALDAHVATCEVCRREMAALAWTKAQAAAIARDVDVPPDLIGHVRQALDGEDREEHRPTVGPPLNPAAGSRSIYWIAAAAALVAFVWLAMRPEAPTAPAQAAADFEAFSSGSMRLEVQTSDPAALETRLRAAGLAFAVRVFDFGMMKYSLTGGGLHRFQDRASALFAYRSADGRGVLCQMYEGDTSELPSPDERRRQNDIDFLVYRQRDLTIVFWEEGDVLCVLVADGDSEAAIRLAFAKAVKV